ncbi:MAG: hypothetical protein BWY52_02364 [Chloroflexi bacterium ADurb.Bin325]|nr:MAG: hypothetical protein BWY52_02364 [Chloroflexi bacterium ADurb.Bin325]
MKDREIRQLLETSRIVAVVGLSDKPDRASYQVAAYLQRNGYRIIPVNPNVGEALGEKSYPSVDAIPEPVDIVDIFRRAEAVGPVVEEAIAAGARAVWMQLGIVNEEAAEAADAAGLQVVMDRCIQIEHARLLK